MWFKAEHVKWDLDHLIIGLENHQLSLFIRIPFGFNQQEMAAWFYHGDGMILANEVYNELNLKFFPAGNTGNQMGGWFNKTIKNVTDFKGLKFRMPGLGGEVLKSYGTNVVLLPGPDVVPAITSGTIDGTEWIGPAADLGKGLHKVCDYYYYLDGTNPVHVSRHSLICELGII